ncbi:hypothetical protein [Roseivirga pacifica]|uniref:hypothetical protein n=1 Tax=Roseivirga pacifica TaxID=1267423 RepID=UPI003BAACA29
MELGDIKAQLKHYTDSFKYNEADLAFNILDFWQWNQSDLIENRNRGILAEFLVMKGLDLKSETRLEWDAYDFKTENGLKIEVKSASYIQAWRQKKLSSISFNIKKTKALLEDNNYANSPERQADIYILCLLHHKDQTTINPMDLKQWRFYLVTKTVLDKELLDQKTLSLSTLKLLPHKSCDFYGLKSCFKELTKNF